MICKEFFKKSLHKIFCKNIFIFSLLFCSAYLCFAEETQWTVGAVKFYYTQSIERNEYENHVLEAVPKLILEQLYGTRERNVPAREILDRQINSLLKERLSLFLELSKEEKVKDALVIKDLSEYQFNKQKNQQEKKIEEIQKKIDKNLESQQELLDKYEKNRSDFVRHNKVTEEFAFYKGDNNSLFSFSDKVDEKNFSSYDYSTEVENAKINGLITGSIITYGQYAAVSAQLVIYPGAIATGVITEVGLLSEPERIAKNIAYRLIPKIENAIPCEIKISILPEEIKDKATMTVDSTRYSRIPENLILSSGVHNISFECEGYKKESFSYGFGYEKDYLIEVEFQKENPIDVALSLKNSLNGNLFYNGIKADGNVMSVKINNQGILGFYQTENDNMLFFMVPKGQIQDNSVVTAKLKDYDVGSYIERNRKLMYVSYSALICSLPYLVYSYSNYMNNYNGYKAGVSGIKPNDVIKYQTMTFIGIGITAACGAWFVFQLVWYLVSANKALPVETKRAKDSYDQAVERFNSEKVLRDEEKRIKEEKEKEYKEKLEYRRTKGWNKKIKDSFKLNNLLPEVKNG